MCHLEWGPVLIEAIAEEELLAHILERSLEPKVFAIVDVLDAGLSRQLLPIARCDNFL